MCDVYEIGIRILFSKQYRYVTNHLHLDVTNDYIFLLCVLLLSMAIFPKVQYLQPNQDSFHSIIY